MAVLDAQEPFVGVSPLLLAEIGQAHEGSLSIALGMIDTIKESGFDGVKFQVHDPETESTLDEAFRPGSGIRDNNRLEYWKRTSFSAEQWEELVLHARDQDLLVVPSTFSIKSIELMSRIGVDAWKIGSGEALQGWFLSAIARMEQPTILSTGMSTWKEIDMGVDILLPNVPWLAVLQSTSAYPVGLPDVGLDVMTEIGSRFAVATGLSDHSGSLAPSMAALARGAKVIEVHATYSKSMPGPDARASLTFEEMKMLSDFRDELAQLDSPRLTKDELAIELASMRAIFGRSVAPAIPIPKGTRIQEDMLLPKKPGGGIPFDQVQNVIGKTAKKELDPNRLLTWEDIEL